MAIRFLILGFFIFSFPASLKAFSEKEELLNQLEKRKKAFEIYLKNKQKRNEKKNSVADSQKKIRKKAIDKQEKARRFFERKEKMFHREDHKSFINWRKKKRKKMEKARVQYAKIKKELRKIRTMKKYKIDGKKEFDLN